ncbi:Ser/Thr protein phosphatase [Tritrichomonas foetus]|uniref:Serine/threonine-protein phosphatase n=1 Tax=Tritrichomonas foetus TaxID=1144522 RepID=A0A1J4JE86_9EUKA|nr:Ser/Thr protein phosphatase [Tritrichomonas foetus]|eukprot:OHS96961.1 Ser/Thr protein phosphatase [Tritrichomonas foetus]
MEAVEAVLSQYQPFFDQSPKGPTPYINENDTIFPRFDEDTIMKICNETSSRLQKNYGPLITVPAPVIYVGDIHGNLTDMIHILHIFGMPPKTRYLFLGDYVDRGSHSIEVITILMALLCKYPDHVYLIRGNHEFSSVNRMYGFYEETLNSYGTEDVWLNCNNVFGYLPFAAIAGDNQIFCVHGGLSPQLDTNNTIMTIKNIDLPVGLYEETELISDLVWSDPVEEISEYEQNKRGCGVLYGKDAISVFLKSNKLKAVLRAHQCVATGYSFNCNNMCITLFSSSNYCKMLQNKCGVILHKKESNELCFYSLAEDSDVGVKPKLVMSIPPATSANVGLKKSTNPSSTSLNSTNSNNKNKKNSGLIPKPPTPRSSYSAASSKASNKQSLSATGPSPRGSFSARDSPYSSVIGGKMGSKADSRIRRQSANLSSTKQQPSSLTGAYKTRLTKNRTSFTMK